MNVIESSVIGIAGCGAMGLPMARNLLDSGHDAIGFDIRPTEDFGSFAPRMVADPMEFAARIETVITVVRDIAETEALLFDDQAIMRGDAAPKRLVVSSTLSPRYIVDLANRLPGIDVIDAPMSGAPYRARAGMLTFMVGGGTDTVEALMPLFKAMGDAVHHLGPTGAGAAAKVCNNLCAAAGVVAVRRALAGARAYGISTDVLLTVMRHSSGSTWYGDNLCDIDWAREGYAPGNTMGILEKDVASFVDALSGIDTLEAGPFEDALIAEIRRLETLP